MINVGDKIELIPWEEAKETKSYISDRSDYFYDTLQGITKKVYEEIIKEPITVLSIDTILNRNLFTVEVGEEKTMYFIYEELIKTEE